MWALAGLWCVPVAELGQPDGCDQLSSARNLALRRVVLPQALRLALPSLQPSRLNAVFLTSLLIPDGRLSMLHDNTRHGVLPGCMGLLQGLRAGTTPPMVLWS